ncbi:MAG: DEAD/DEAH box helicase [Candidatus Zixiibacteriota bacterium]|nr:MAG: DEAD/DEAH box helicase [candidate division Zixibacteria bacterium]
MRLKDVAKFDIPESIIDAWIGRQGDYLLPLQENAIRAGLLTAKSDGRLPSLLISAPTSAGKSFCGEMAAVVSLLRREKAVILLPLKSIAEEKYDYFRKCYRPLGIRTLIVTADHPETDGRFAEGDFDLALAIYEKFNRLLTVNVDVLQRVGLVVVDELQMISDRQRGPELEMALGKILSSGYHPRLIALSAVLDDESELADWLGCEVIRETVRPVDLLQGIASGGHFTFRSFNSGLEGREEFPVSGNGGSLAESLINFLKQSKSRKLVFLKSRRDTIEAAFKLAAAVGWKEAKEALARLEGEETSFLVRALRQTLSRGIAFHNADLTPQQRQAIEHGYQRGEIRVIFSTTTLAMGVNLPAEMVLLETVKYSSGNFGHRGSLVPISAAEYQNIAGRAGRFGLDPSGKPGRAVVLADSDFEHEVLWAQYIDAGRGEPVVSTLSGKNQDDVVLDMVASGFAGTLKQSLSNLLYYRQGNQISHAQLERILDELAALGLIRQPLQPTPLGTASAESGLSTGTCHRYVQLIDRRFPESLVGWLFLGLTAREFDISRAWMTRSEYRQRLYERMLHQHFCDHLSEIASYADVSVGREPLDFKTSAILKAVFLLSDWAGGRGVEELEKAYQLHHGQIINLAETAAWLLRSLGRIIYATNCSSSIPARLEDLSFSVHFGIDAEMRDIHRLTGAILSRPDYRLLRENNILSLNELMKAADGRLLEIIKPESKLKRLVSRINRLAKEDNMNGKFRDRAYGVDNRAASIGACRSGYPCSLELDGAYERERYLVKIDGFPVRLTGKSFKFLAKLALARLAAGDGWIYKDDLEAGFNQARYLYRLKTEMKEGGFSWAIFENNRLGYYRLALEPSRIRMNVENLKNHPDYEVRQGVDQVALRMAI